jgi:hypothetical protein
MSDLAYPLVRELVEQLGGIMEFQRSGFRHGAWIIRLPIGQAAVSATGARSFPALDQLHIPKVPHPATWDDYERKLVPDAQARLLGLVTAYGAPRELPLSESSTIAAAIASARWKFAWTYARTYPHEHTTRDRCSEVDHAALIDAIERYGVVERFGSTHRKYLYFEKRKYWHMGDPYSEDPENHPNVINRSWVDVRRHAQNVAHVWTSEEVELQMRLWEIQLEKSTDGKR